MALTAVDFHVFQSLRQHALLPPQSNVLELGEAEWYGDLSPEVLRREIDALADTARRERLRQDLDAALAAPKGKAWLMAKVFYRLFLDYRRLASIDFHGTSEALQLDLNYPIDPAALGAPFDVLIDGGTAEHVFNVFQLFKTCHEVTRPGGLMLHVTPFRGWLEHGFYNFNPTFYWDVAAANGYRMVMLVYNEIDPPRLVQLDRREKIVEMANAGELGASAMLTAVLRKADAETPFRIPNQGYYAGVIGDEMDRAWHDVR